MKAYPALDVACADPDFALALADDYSPTAAEARDGFVTIFFSDKTQRDLAHDAIARAWPTAALSVREVDDEDWARRSQETLTAVTVGRVTVAPPWAVPGSVGPDQTRSPDVRPPVVVIEPSMGFGTGHHATTRLCLLALQTVDLDGAVVLDIGPGSGVLALAASRLGARRAIGLDTDPDAIQTATDNLQLNAGLAGVTFRVAGLESLLPLAEERTEGPLLADVVAANLTGALLVRSASTLLGAVAPGGIAVVSGLLEHERNDVVAAFSGAGLVWESTEDGWVGLTFRLPRV